MKKSYQYLISMIGGVVLTVISSFVGKGCHMVPPGGMNEGWKGLPLPFYSCGVWGEDSNLLINFVNFLFWSLVVFAVLLIVLKVKSRKAQSKTDSSKNKAQISSK